VRSEAASVPAIWRRLACVDHRAKGLQSFRWGIRRCHSELCAYFLFRPRGVVPLDFMTRAAGLDMEFVPTVSMLFRLSFIREKCGCNSYGGGRERLGAVVFLGESKNMELEAGRTALLAVSITFAPYAWLTDEAALLPLVFAGLYALESAGLSLVPFGCIAGVALVEVLAGVTMPRLLRLDCAGVARVVSIYRSRYSWPSDEASFGVAVMTLSHDQAPSVFRIIDWQGNLAETDE